MSHGIDVHELPSEGYLVPGCMSGHTEVLHPDVPDHADPYDGEGHRTQDVLLVSGWV